MLFLSTDCERRFVRTILEPGMEYGDSGYQSWGLYTLCMTGMTGRKGGANLEVG